jgi:cytosine/adenosine deaminase-related metal-dependent hydrolase
MCLQHLSRFPSVFAFPEIIGLDKVRFTEAAQWAIELAANELLPEPICQIGLSPHAPYSIHFPTAVKVLGSSFARRQVTAMHIAESLDERQWLETGAGPFRDVFERLGVPADAPRSSLIDIVKWLAGCRRALLIHGNYLDEVETDLIARSAISIVYCPRTHRHFGHSEYPLRRFINSQINVVLGTDSRASNPDLDLWSEVIALRESHPWVTPDWAYSAVTQRSAEALGVGSDFGTLLAGRVAAINVSRFDSAVAKIELLEELTTRERPFTPLADILSELDRHGKGLL